MRIVVLCLGILALAIPASASLIGDEIVIEFGTPGGNNLPGHTYVGPVVAGPELNINNVTDIDVQASSIVLTNVGLALGFSTPSLGFTDLDWVDMPGVEIIGFEATPGLMAIGWNDGRVTFGPHSLLVDLEDLRWNRELGELLTIDLITNHDVPEPTTSTLFTLGLVGLATRRRVA